MKDLLIEQNRLLKGYCLFLENGDNTTKIGSHNFRKKIAEIEKKMTKHHSQSTELRDAKLRDDIIHYQIWVNNFQHEYVTEQSTMQLVNEYFKKQ